MLPPVTTIVSSINNILEGILQYCLLVIFTALRYWSLAMDWTNLQLPVSLDRQIIEGIKKTHYQHNDGNIYFITLQSTQDNILKQKRDVYVLHILGGI